MEMYYTCPSVRQHTPNTYEAPFAKWFNELGVKFNRSGCAAVEAEGGHPLWFAHIKDFALKE